ncbi:hypothetical protein WJ39_12090 [Burkholderia diffusa]|nr:hypothetical protein WJ39_12090 [Burkholderia diffusa]
MSNEQIASMLRNLAKFVDGQPIQLEFVWHGGEPLLRPVAFYRQILEDQHEILGAAGIQFSNSIQTNLTVLNPERIDLIKEMFEEIGVSVDLFGANRVDSRGRDAQARVLNHMQTLIDNDINFGCISVLSQSTAPHVDEIYDFFEELDLSFRLLPIYRTGYDGQLTGHALAPETIVAALKRAADRWLASNRFIRVEPVCTYVAQVVRALSRDSKGRSTYDKEDGEVIFIVDTDGSVYSNGDAYDSRLCHGNIFTESVQHMRQSAGFRQALQESRDRVTSACCTCPYFGACTGFIMGEATPEQRWSVDHRLSCAVARPMHEYIEGRLRALGLIKTPDLLDGRELYRRAFAA